MAFLAEKLAMLGTHVRKTNVCVGVVLLVLALSVRFPRSKKQHIGFYAAA